MDRLAAIRSFVEAVDRDGFSAAGKVLGLSGPMVGNHVRHLEAQLGGLLLNRTTRVQSLTELGRAYLAHCRTILAALDAAEAEAQELIGEPRGRLRVTAPQSIGSTVLPPVIAAFIREHPAVNVDLHLDDGRLDLLSSGCDVALRVGNLEDATLITRTLAPLELVVCAAPSYLKRRGEPTNLADLTSHDCLDFVGSSTPSIWHFETEDGTQSITVSGPMRANSGFALRAAAVDGLGIVMTPEIQVREEIRRKRLMILLPQFRPQCRPVQLLTLPDRNPPPKLRAFINRVVGDLGANSSS